MRSRRARRALSIAAASLAMLSFPVGKATSQEQPALYAWGLTATASSISFLYNQPTFGVPSDPTFELNKAYSQADLDSGPSAHGLSSLLWPGQVIGNASPSLAFDTLVFNPTKIPDLNKTCLPEAIPVPSPSPASTPGPPDFRCYGLDPLKTYAGQATAGSPPYPLRGECFFPPEACSVDRSVATGRMSAQAAEDRSAGAALLGGVDPGGVIKFGTASSSSSSAVVNDKAVAKATSVVTDLDFLGLIHVDEILTTVTATSDGKTGVNEGSVQVIGLTIPGEGGQPTKITVDANGFHAPGNDVDGERAKELIAEYLEPRGIFLSVGAPLPTTDGPKAASEATGLIVHLDARGMEELLTRLPVIELPTGEKIDIRGILRSPTSDPRIARLFGGPLPDPIPGSPLSYPNGVLSPFTAGLLASFFQGDQDMNFVFGSASVSSIAAPALPEFQIPDVELPFSPPVGDLGGGDLGGLTGGTTTTPLRQGGRVLAARPVGVKGVPAGLVGLAFALAIAGAGGMRKVADLLTAPRTVTVRCIMGEK